MAHLRKPLGIALWLNTVVIIVETASGIAANSLSLMIDAVHNVSDELTIALLLLAYTLRAGLSGNLLRSANLFSAVGFLVIIGLFIWQATERLIHPPPVSGLIAIVGGLIGAAANGGVAAILRKPSREDPSIRLAYIHNLADVLVSLMPAGAGILVIATGSLLFDPLAAFLIAVVIIVTTFRAIIGPRRELLWPANIVCGPRASVPRTE